MHLRTRNNLYCVKCGVHVFSGSSGSAVDQRTKYFPLPSQTSRLVWSMVKSGGAIAEYPVEIEAGGGGGKGLASTRQISSVAGSLSEAISYEMATHRWIIERGNFLCAGYASKIKLRVPVFVLLCRVSWVIERGNF